jgi:hypothetical protein
MKKYIKKPGSTKKSNGHWKIKENCIAEAKKHNTIREWQLKSPGSLTAAYKYKWMYDCCLHMKSKVVVSTPTEVKKHPPTLDKRIEAEKKVMGFLGFN